VAMSWINCWRGKIATNNSPDKSLYKFLKLHKVNNCEHGHIFINSALLFSLHAIKLISEPGCSL
ncbi:hypothetical protein, partial [Escherichia coli]|uniref:hypothetical protein n=1 Tax=Escherichia coli TaxID=562 RepID=UPI001BA53792